MKMQERIKAELIAALAPARLEVLDESASHAGHAGARPGGETHFRIRIASVAFAGKTRVQRHQLVYAALKAEIDDGVHALAIHADLPDA